jgi:nicotinamide mononucleotide transporter
VENFFHQFIQDIIIASWLEWVAVLSGILSVWFSKKEKVWVYPIGLINTLIYVYLSAKASLFGESMVNGYYTVMGVYGWWCWTQKDTTTKAKRLNITYSSGRERIFQFLFFIVLFIVFFLTLSYLKNHFYPGSIPWADSLATAAAFTGMWLMTRKKIESWYWWMATNFISVPLYIYKGYALTGVYYVILFVLAFAGLREWKKKNDLFVERKLT